MSHKIARVPSENSDQYASIQSDPSSQGIQWVAKDPGWGRGGSGGLTIKKGRGMLPGARDPFQTRLRLLSRQKQD